MLENSSQHYTNILIFLDYLRFHPGTADEYAAFKRRLSSRQQNERAEYQ